MDDRHNGAGQRIVLDLGVAHVVAIDSAYHVTEANRGRDVVVNASYTGVLPARFIAEKAPAGAIGLDCAVGPEGASIAGLWYLEALGLPAATVDVGGVVLGDGVDMYEHGHVSYLNQPARDLGVAEGQTVEQAARAMLSGATRFIATGSAAEVTNRRTMIEDPSGRTVVCTDSIAFGLPEDRAATVLVTAGHTGRSAVPYLERVLPHAFICSDGGMGRNRSGVAALPILDARGVPGAAVDARTARMGDALSSWSTGIISATNALARQAGVTEGMSCRDAAALLVAWAPQTKESDHE